MENYYSSQFYVQNKDTTRQDGGGKQNYAKYAAYLLGLPWFACAASDFDAGRMGFYCDITSENPTCISPPPAFPIQHKADIGLSV